VDDNWTTTAPKDSAKLHRVALKCHCFWAVVTRASSEAAACALGLARADRAAGIPMIRIRRWRRPSTYVVSSTPWRPSLTSREADLRTSGHRLGAVVFTSPQFVAPTLIHGSRGRLTLNGLSPSRAKGRPRRPGVAPRTCPCIGVLALRRSGSCPPWLPTDHPQDCKCEGAGGPVDRSLMSWRPLKIGAFAGATGC